MAEINPTPDVPKVQKDSAFVKPAVKPATPDLILFNDAEIPTEFITDLLFEQLGGKEIITIARNDIINGQKISYNLIPNSFQLSRTYGTNIFRVPGTSAEFFDNFAIKFGLYVPDNQKTASLNARGGLSIILESSAIRRNDRVQIEVLTEGSLESDTIY
jgi:hypothetical protein